MDLKGTYLKYSEEITEDVFDRIIKEMESLGINEYSNGNSYKDFKRYEYFLIKDSGWFVGNGIYSKLKEITVSDILGDNKKQNVVLVDGGYYVVELYGSIYLLKFVGDGSNCDNIQDWKNFHINGKFNDYNWDFSRLATPEEKQWLNCCIESGRFVSKEEALSSKGKLASDWYKSLKKGDFVVSVSGTKPYYEKDNIYEFAKRESRTLYTTIDSAGTKMNGWSYPNFRPASQQEKELYLLFGKPVHINTPLPKDNSSTALKQASNELLEEAKRRYPIGTKFYPAHAGDDGKEFCIVTNNNFMSENDCSYVYALTDNGGVYDKSRDGKCGNTDFNRIVCERGKWAEIIEQPKQTNRCVHVTTKQQWDFVGEKLGYKDLNKSWNIGFDCVSLSDFDKGGDLVYCEQQNYQILSFDQWLKETNNKVSWMVFIGAVTCHRSSDRTNNKIENLVWVDPYEKVFGIKQQPTKNDIVLLGGEFVPVKVNEYKEPNINF
jgi:hypothetical protein